MPLNIKILQGSHIMNKLLAILLLTCLALVTGCNGSSGANTDSSGNSLLATTMTIELYNVNSPNQQSFDKADIITIKAFVYDQNGDVLENQKVTFTADIGALSTDAKLSDATGLAQVTLSNADLAIGAGSVTATINELSASVDYEFINSDIIQGSPVITTQLRLNNTAVTQFKANEIVQITTVLMDKSAQLLANKIVTFTADIGTLNTTTALTNSAGVATVTLSSPDNTIGAGVVTATYTDEINSAISVNNRINYEIIAADAVVINDDVRIGYFDVNNVFVEGEIKLSVSNNTISAGGTLGLQVDLIDSNNNLVSTPTSVAFTSNCVQSTHATIDATVFSVKGSAKATFEDVSCAGASGTDDVLVATITINGITSTAAKTISITGEDLGSIAFISAAPTSIVLKGTGGQGKEETSTLTFKVKGILGNPLAQQNVEFSLNTSAGDIVLSPLTGLTNSQGLITTRVTAGSVPTAVRVTALATMTNNNVTTSVQTQSDLLSINTGLPEQRSFTLAASVLNPEAGNINGQKSVISAWLADNFNNPVPDGTTVNFTTEGGVIEPSCVTANGTCSVTWTSAEPRVPDHRVTILATALGHETFFDTNGNNTFDDSDGVAINGDEVDVISPTLSISVASGFKRASAAASGFVDMSEAWRDDNENGIYDAGESFLDFNNSTSYTSRDSLFNGPQCQGTRCAGETERSLHIRKALVLVMASSSALYELSDTNTGSVFNNSNGVSNAIPDIADSSSQAFSFSFSDTAAQTLPLGTTVEITVQGGEVAGNTSYTVSNNNSSGSANMDFILVNPFAGDPEIATITIKITPPNGSVTSVVTTVNLL